MNPAGNLLHGRRKEAQMDLLWIIIIVLVLLALFGGFGYSRRRR
jgi:flagellar basal body-associated protein FliL